MADETEQARGERIALAILFVFDGLLGPILLLLVILSLSSLGTKISKVVCEYKEPDKCPVMEPAKPDKPPSTTNNNATSPPSDITQASTKTTRFNLFGKELPGIDRLLKKIDDALNSVAQETQRVTHEVVSKVDQAVDAQTDKIKSLVMDSATWRFLKDMREITLELASILIKIFWYIVFYFMWRLTRFSQIVKAYYLFQGREMPSYIRSALS